MKRQHDWAAPHPRQRPPFLGRGQPQDTTSVSCSLLGSWARLRRPALPLSQRAHTLQEGPSWARAPTGFRARGEDIHCQPGHSCGSCASVRDFQPCFSTAGSIRLSPGHQDPAAPEIHLNALGVNTELPSLAESVDASRGRVPACTSDDWLCFPPGLTSSQALPGNPDVFSCALSRLLSPVPFLRMSSLSS